jgi:hypothetical protein
VIASVKTNEPPSGQFATTVTDAPLLGPEMLAHPGGVDTMLQLWVTVPPPGVTVDVKTVVASHATGPFGVMSHVGFGFTGIVTVHEPGQPSRLMVSVKVYEQSTSVGPANTITVA